MSDVTPQPDPKPNVSDAVWSAVIADMHARDAEGRRKYGTPLQPFNGRDPLVDAYQEALDLAVYLKQAIIERRGEVPAICTWTEQDPWGPTPLTWDGTCGVTYYVSEGSLADNKVHFCPECGGRIVEVPWPPDDSDEGDEVAR